MWQENHRTDLCVVGGGMSGLCAAVAAARNGAKVVLIQDRPMLGGNASSEIRMWILGAHGKNKRETGILEEIFLENHYRNPHRNYSIWDTILWEKAAFEENITLLLNCSVNDLEMDGDRIASVRAWQTTTYTWHTIEANYFADCSGDSILAPLSGAEYRHGREAKSEYNETIPPDEADEKTMGNSILIQPMEMEEPRPFIPPTWANVYETDEDLPHRAHNIRNPGNNFWWIELGGEQHTIRDAEEIRDDLLKVAYGVWDHIKNQQDHDADNWDLNWIGMLPGKRESRRYIGDYVMTENDVLAEGKFDDIVAYGGWTMDDHHPGGMNWPGHPTIHHRAPSPFGIPYRSLYSRNVANLFFAGRNISVTHAALSATRVMATCAVIGQAVGTAAAIAARDGLSPREVYEKRIRELQQTLMDDDAWLPWLKRDIPALSKTARLTASHGDPEPLRNGYDRPESDAVSNDRNGARDSSSSCNGQDNSGKSSAPTTDNDWRGPLNAWIEYSFDKPKRVSLARIVFDSDLNRARHSMAASYPKNFEARPVPETLVKAFRIEAKDAEGNWYTAAREDNNYQRLVRVPLDIETVAVRLIPESTWGSDDARIFSFDVR